MKQHYQYHHGEWPDVKPGMLVRLRKVDWSDDFREPWVFNDGPERIEAGSYGIVSSIGDSDSCVFVLFTRDDRSCNLIEVRTSLLQLLG